MSEQLKAILARELESSEPAEEVEAAWRLELHQRLDQLRAEEAELVEWADARSAIRSPEKP